MKWSSIAMALSAVVMFAGTTQAQPLFTHDFGILVAQVIPEPSTVGLALMGALFMTLKRRRKA